MRQSHHRAEGQHRRIHHLSRRHSNIHSLIRIVRLLSDNMNTISATLDLRTRRALLMCQFVLLAGHMRSCRLFEPLVLYSAKSRHQRLCAIVHFRSSSPFGRTNRSCRMKSSWNQAQPLLADSSLETESSRVALEHSHRTSRAQGKSAPPISAKGKCPLSPCSQAKVLARNLRNTPWTNRHTDS